MTDTQTAELVARLRDWGENDPLPEYFAGDVLSAVLADCRQAADRIEALQREIALRGCIQSRVALRAPLAEGREHLTVSGTFQSDKYPWCPAGFVPLKLTDQMARDLLAAYAERRRAVDAAFADDLLDALAAPAQEKQP